MIGFDRPLQPDWIYNTLKMIEVGKSPSDYYHIFDKEIVLERIGKDGVRKIRTVLFRTFIYSFQNQKNTIENNLLIELCKKYDMEFMKPVLVSQLLMHYEIFRFFTKKIQQLFDPLQEVNSSIITRKMIEEFGDTEIVKRSVRSFLKTLSSFGILEPVSTTRYLQFPRKMLNENQVRYIIKLYADNHHTRQIDIQNFDNIYFAYWQQPDISKTALHFHNQEWEYIRGYQRELLLLK